MNILLRPWEFAGVGMSTCFCPRWANNRQTLMSKLISIPQFLIFNGPPLLRIWSAIVLIILFQKRNNKKKTRMSLSPRSVRGDAWRWNYSLPRNNVLRNFWLKKWSLFVQRPNRESHRSVAGGGVEFRDSSRVPHVAALPRQKFFPAANPINPA